MLQDSLLFLYINTITSKDNVVLVPEKDLFVFDSSLFPDIHNFRFFFNSFCFDVCFLLGNSLGSEFYMPTFRNILSDPSP
jgi:hypothetical protein